MRRKIQTCNVACRNQETLVFAENMPNFLLLFFARTRIKYEILSRL
jgi:hypothetical protein